LTLQKIGKTLSVKTEVYSKLLKNLKGDRGARKLFQEKAEQVYSLPLNEAATDIDTPKDWEDFIG
jgi:CTP:molybdopterin cytidylyltransferase MocA